MACLYPKLIRNIKGEFITVSCRKCHNCRIQRQSDLEFACLMALQQGYKYGTGATFLTLTYDDAHVPLKLYNNEPYTNLEKKDFTKFWSDFRKVYREKKEYVPQMVTCGEYGDSESRCHFHSLIFGSDADTVKSVTKQIWTNGIFQSGTLRPGGIRYVIDYIMKQNDEVYNKEYIEKGLNPPFLCHSTRLGLDYFFNDFSYFPEDFTYMRNGNRIPIPANYRKRLPGGASYKYEPTVEYEKAYSQGLPYDVYCLDKSIDNAQNDIIKRRQSGKPCFDLDQRMINYVTDSRRLFAIKHDDKERVRKLFRDNGLPDWRDYYTPQVLDQLSHEIRSEFIKLVVKLDPYPPPTISSVQKK